MWFSDCIESIARLQGLTCSVQLPRRFSFSGWLRTCVRGETWRQRADFGVEGAISIPAPRRLRQDEGSKPSQNATRKRFKHRRAASTPNLVAFHPFYGPSFCRPASAARDGDVETEHRSAEAPWKAGFIFYIIYIVSISGHAALWPACWPRSACVLPAGLRRLLAEREIVMM